MNAFERTHLAAFRTAVRLSGTGFVVGKVTACGVRNRKPKRSVSPLDPNPGADAPERFTAAQEDFPEGLPEQGNEIISAGIAYRITAIDPQFPLVHFDCAKGVPL